MTIPSSSEEECNHMGDPVVMSRDDFQNFVTTWAPDDVIEEEDVYLEPLLNGWLSTTAGIESTAASYDHCLQVVLAIIDAVLKGTLSLDYQGTRAKPFTRRMVGLLDPRLSGNALSRMGFDQLKYQTLEEQRAKELKTAVHRALWK